MNSVFRSHGKIIVSEKEIAFDASTRKRLPEHLYWKKEVAFDAFMRKRLSHLYPASQIRPIGVVARRITVTSFRYLSNGHEVEGLIVEPRDGREKLPCIIANRGGSRALGTFPLGFIFGRLGEMALWGYVIVTSQLSGSPGSEGKDEFGGSDLNDVLMLKDILALHRRADTRRIGMWGGSRGGMMTYLALKKVKWIKAAVTFAGLADLERSSRMRKEMRNVYRDIFGGSRKEMRKRSAVLWCERFPKTTPLLIMHGTADWRVSPLDSVDVSRKLLEHGIPHRLVLFEKDDHFLSNRRQEAEQLTRDWFDRFVRDGEKIPEPPKDLLTGVEKYGRRSREEVIARHTAAR